MLKKVKNQKGAITVEATISLTAFLFMFMMLYSIIIVCRAQAIVGSALNNTAKEISQYTYLYSLTGIHESLGEATSTSVTGDVDKLAENINTSFNAMQGLNEDANTVVKTDITDMGGVLSDWNTINIDMREDAENLKGGISGIQDTLENLAKDPKSLLIGLCKIAASDGISLAKSKLITPPICRVLIQKHLASYNGESTEAFLKDLHIVPANSSGDISYLKGIDFSNSSLFSSKDYDIVIRAEYEVQIIPYLPLDIKIKLCQSAATRGWADGDGRHVDNDGQVVIVEADIEETTTSSKEESEPENETRQKIVSEYGENIVIAIEKEKADADPPISEWTEDDWRYYIKLYLDDCESSYSKGTLAEYTSGTDISTAIKTTLDKLISENPDKKSELEVYYSEDKFLKLINKYTSEYNSGKYSVVIDQYSEIEALLLEEVHEQTRPKEYSIMQKIVSAEDFNNYYKNDAAVQIGGCVTRVEDAIDYTTTYSQARENLRLDYQDTKFSSTGGSCYIVRYENETKNKYERSGGREPCTCNGFTASSNGIISEWCVSGKIYPEKGAVYKIDTSGNEECVGIIINGKFYKYE